MDGRMINKNRKLNRKCKKCGHNIDDRSKSGLCKKCCRKGEQNPFYGKKHSKKTREKMIKAAKKRDNSTYYKIPITKEIIQKRELVKKKNWDKLSLEEKHNKIKNWINAGKRKKDTKIEKIVRKMLSNIGLKRKIDFQTNMPIGAYNVDILIYDRYIIDCYGDYWHKNPKYYNNYVAIQKQKKDVERKQFLEEEGYKFISFWEEDIHNDLDNIENQTKKFLGSYVNLFEWESCFR